MLGCIQVHHPVYCLSHRNAASNCSPNRISWPRWQRLWADWLVAKTLQNMQTLTVWAIPGLSSVTRPANWRARERRTCSGLKNTMTVSLQWRRCLNRCPKSGTIWPGVFVHQVYIKIRHHILWCSDSNNLLTRPKPIKFYLRKCQLCNLFFKFQGPWKKDLCLRPFVFHDISLSSRPSDHFREQI